jgi:hypothetical protein
VSLSRPVLLCSADLALVPEQARHAVIEAKNWLSGIAFGSTGD